MVLTKAAFMILLVAFLVPIEATQSENASPPTPPAATVKPITPDQYLAQVDKSNAALDKFLKLPCDDKGIPDAAQDLMTQMVNLKDAYAGLPDTGQDVLVQDRESELYVGFIDLANSYIKEKQETCSPTTKPDDDQTPEPADNSYTNS